MTIKTLSACRMVLLKYRMEKEKQKPPVISRLIRMTVYLLTLLENYQIRGKGIESLTQSREYCFPVLVSNVCLVLAVSPLSRSTGGFHMAWPLGYPLR